MNKGYFDIQVNGYGGVDFNQDHLTAEQLNQACRRLESDGVTGFLPTLITEDLDRMVSRLTNMVRLREADPLAGQLIRGFHIEGPFINETDGYRGAHPLHAVCPATTDAAKRLTDAGGGLVRLVTLAPERDGGFEVTRMLADQGVVVSAGHCNPTLDQLRGAVDAGLTMFTHLGNGCPMQMHRHDNVIQRVLSLSDKLWICLIADGVHVPFVALGNYLRVAGIDRCMVVTDAIAPAGMGPGDYTLGRWRLTIGEDMVARAPDGSHLVGSAISMPRCDKNLTERLNLNAEDVARLTRENPCRAIGLSLTDLIETQGLHP